MIKPTSWEWTKAVFHFVESKWILPRKFKRIQIHGVDLKPNHSILLLQNHISWWDGFWGSYLCYEYFHKHFYVMVQEDQLAKHSIFRYKGAFSIKKQSREALKSLSYTADLLKHPKNLVLLFPQGRLQSMHVSEIDFEKGVFHVIDQIDTPCQIIYCASVLEYLESFKPTVHLHLLDCGTPGELSAEELEAKVSSFHAKALKEQVRG
ncbi:MAG: 1-acyl-sn-glycerol-3-phosphate acyltransferase [Ekhidna sp.]|nr:1-acyl-sn-glycerol-3-phosphate acyltransferase [Ekhidna sp.]